jgi:ElaA protein
MELFVKHFSALTADELYSILEARAAVFVVEQKCPYQDLDGKDRDAYHVWLGDGGRVAAYLRVLAPGVSFREQSLGRVITTVRGAGLGARILKAGMKASREKYGPGPIRIGAQRYAKGFYEKAGFRQDSQVYFEDGIPHIEMLLGAAGETGADSRG